MMGIANSNPNDMSFGWFDNNYNPHYGVGVGWSYPASVWFDTGNNWYARGSMRAPIFYDWNNTGYYVDPNGYSEFGTSGHVMTITKLGTGPNSRALQVANNQGDNSWGIVSEFRVNGSPGTDRPSILFSSGFNSSTWSCGYGYADDSYFRINHDHGHRNQSWGTTDFYVDRGGNSYSNGSSRAPIFYDQNDTSYYSNPNGFSQMSSANFNNYIDFARLRPIGVGGNSGQGTNPYDIFQEGGGWGYPYPDLRIAYHTGIKLGANAGSYEGTRVYSDYDMSDLCIQLAGSSNYSFKYKWMYTNNTGFYSDYNGAHWYPNDITYGAWRMNGNRNGWYGHAIDSAYLPHYMWESGNGGIYLQNAGRWVLYHSLGNNCTGMGTSATAGGYAIYCNGGVYATGNIVAYSDIRKKKDVVTVDNALNKILELRGVYYTKIYNENDTIPDGGADKRQLGVVAQEVNEVVPEVVSYTEHLDEYAVAYGNFAGLFIQGFKEQQIIINKQADEINLLKEELQKIKDLILNINKE
jgi:hypothetical protein